jgi:cyclohexanecarboxylate-CoA ligase
VQTFWQLMTEAATRAPSRVVLADDHGRSLTTSQLCTAAEQVAAGLGVQPGTVVSWQLPTTIEGIIVLAALARAAAVQNPIIPILREREVGLGVVNSWGLTEFPVATSSTPDDSPRVLAETVGRPCPGVSIRQVDGELRLRGAQCFLGYVDPAGDAAAFDDEGWFRTGDLGEIDPDGNVRITGRLKDVIIRNAENISALGLEDVLLRHPGVADVAVVGLPDKRTGERVCAVVVPEPGHTITLPALAEHCRVEGVARQKWPEQLQLVDVLPRNAMGKILKQALRDGLIGYNI